MFVLSLQVLKLEFELEESDEQSLKLQSHNQKQRAIIEKRNKRIQELASSSRVAVAPGASYSPAVVPKTTAPQPVLLLSRIQVPLHSALRGLHSLQTLYGTVPCRTIWYRFTFAMT